LTVKQLIKLVIFRSKLIYSGSIVFPGLAAVAPSPPRGPWPP
jgi:hypothetical protein